MKLFGLNTGWILGISVALSFLSGVYVTRLYYLVDISQEKLVEAKQQAKIAESARIAHEAAVERQNANEVKRDKEKKDAYRETDALRTKFLNDAVSLRVEGMPQTSTNSSGVATGTCALSARAGERVFALRYGINELEADYDLCIDTLYSDRGTKNPRHKGRGQAGR